MLLMFILVSKLKCSASTNISSIANEHNEPYGQLKVFVGFNGKICQIFIRFLLKKSTNSKLDFPKSPIPNLLGKHVI